MRIHIPVRALVLFGAAIAILAMLAFAALPGPRDALTPRPSAGRPSVDAQVAAATYAVQRGYARAEAQLAQVRQLKLALTEDQAAATERKAKDDLAAVRRQALATIAGLLGLKGAQIEPYVVSLERELARADLKTEGILLAPQLFNVVRRSDELFAQTADRATRELTGSAAPSPRPSGP